jgi:flagellar motor protein MotB
VKHFASAPSRRRTFDTWQIIYIDLMTNVMIFFVILWAITQRPDSHGISDTIGTETVKMVNLPGDVLFVTGRNELSAAGREVMAKLFADPSGTVLNFDTGLVKRLLVIHGHTDSDGGKDRNFELGYQRALAAYREIQKHGGGEVADHVVICSHADNSPAEEVPAFEGTLSDSEASAVREAKARNRRITIEDKLVSRVKGPPR